MLDWGLFEIHEVSCANIVIMTIQKLHIPTSQPSQFTTLAQVKNLPPADPSQTLGQDLGRTSILPIRKPLNTALKSVLSPFANHPLLNSALLSSSELFFLPVFYLTRRSDVRSF